MTETVATGTDPSRTPFSELALSQKHLCDHSINGLTSCRHGCRFYYVPTTPSHCYHIGSAERVGLNAPQREWDDSVFYDDEPPKQLESALDSIDLGDRAFEPRDRDHKISGISYSTHWFIDGCTSGIIWQCIEFITEFGHYARLQTRNRILPLPALDVFQTAGEHITVGILTSTLSDAGSTAIASLTPAPSHWIRNFKKSADASVQVLVSVGLTYLTRNRADIRESSEPIATVDPVVILHEPINSRGANFELTTQTAADTGEDDLRQALIEIDDRRPHWIDYQLKHFRWAQAIDAESGLLIHLWPGSHLRNSVDAREWAWLQTRKDRMPLELSVGRNPPVDLRPELSHSDPQSPTFGGDRYDG